MEKELEVKEVEKTVLSKQEVDPVKEYKKDKMNKRIGTTVAVGGIAAAAIAGTYLGINGEPLYSALSFLAGMGVTIAGFNVRAKGTEYLEIDKLMAEEKEEISKCI